MTARTDGTTGGTARIPGSPILSVRDLHVRFGSEAGSVHAVRGVDLDLYPGRVLGIVGESGSGKSVTSLAIMGLLPETAKVTGSITYGGKELLGLSDREMSRHRGSDISMIFQDPLSSLTPVFTVGDQIVEALQAHSSISRQKARVRAIELLDLVGIPSPRTRVDSYPHEFSGGMRQRVVIAIAIANDPRVIIADEPTTALDVTIQAQILDLLTVAQEETGAAVVMITHDLGVVAGVADDVMVMYAGRPVEKGFIDDVYQRPSMPYTVGLLGSIPRVDRREKSSLVPIEGNPPNLLVEPTGCPFLPRCPVSAPVCAEQEPPLAPVAPDHATACVRSRELLALPDPQAIFPVPPVPHAALSEVDREQREPVLRVSELHKHFPLMKGAFLKRQVGDVKAVDGIDLDIVEGECLALVGESGCGKTTTLLEIMELSPKTRGDIRVLGTSVHDLRRKSEVTGLRRNIQLVFQDPMGALDPRFTVYEIIAEPLQAYGTPAKECQDRVRDLMATVGLEPDHLNRFPTQFSGGQRQRIGIARALALKPKLLILDEPVSALDVSVQAGIINLLDRLKADLGISYLFVAHDLAVVRHISDRVAVMYLGKIVEIGQVDEVFEHPTHPYTRALLSAIPVPDPVKERSRQRILLQGDLPSPLDRPVGCDFATRCPVFLGLDEVKRQQCRSEEPPLVPIGTADHRQACFFPEEQLVSAHVQGSSPQSDLPVSGPSSERSSS
ncbi:peptide/nickel transport system ATP-binding protein [Austwickia chelonae]|uniref:Putative ABC transporter ATP-binding protein n=1 Tax=Austwickia chelonae NBRC 105200 TaxID=1184607 RepID=K6VN20_9MICO|nr:ABC transporter ATP-binding protein [Austwickia chelonae]GAB76775.1 putative ABC transporter ATP-binding protein [Austwickia chelonae NBRC 105200]SEW30518.1 peptide/nickel transport system ATP-binding protein [Austwickia chelonae]